MATKPGDENVRVYTYGVEVRVAVDTETREVRGVQIADGLLRQAYGLRLQVTSEESDE